MSLHMGLGAGGHILEPPSAAPCGPLPGQHRPASVPVRSPQKVATGPRGCHPPSSSQGRRGRGLVRSPSVMMPVRAHLSQHSSLVLKPQPRGWERRAQGRSHREEEGEPGLLCRQGWPPALTIFSPLFPSWEKRAFGFSPTGSLLLLQKRILSSQPRFYLAP